MKLSRRGIALLFVVANLMASFACEDVMAERRRVRFFNRRAIPSRFTQNNRFIVRNNFQNNQFNRNQFNNDPFINGNNQLINNQNNFVEVPGFSNLLKQGNAIVERNSFGEVRRLTIDGSGILRGASEATTVRQLREFFLSNRDKFNNNQRRTVDRFLGANGGLSNGRFVIDLKNIAIPEGVPKGRELEAALATLNFLLNTLQTNSKLRVSPQNIRADGTVELDLSPFFNNEALALLKAADPTAQCTGKTRLDRLAAFTMDPANYYKFINAPNTRAELAQTVGVQEDKAATSGNKILIGTDKDGNFESGVTKNLRVLEVQTQKNIGRDQSRPRSCYRSLDVVDRLPPGEQSSSRDVTEKGIFFTHDAEEWLCLGRNGMMQGFLFNADGKLLTRAPAEIATNPGPFGPAISAVASCLDCHKDGFMGGGPQRNDPTKNYTDHFNSIPDKPTVFRDTFGRNLTSRGFFTNNQKFYARVQFDSQTMIQSQIELGARFIGSNGKSVALLPNQIKAFDRPPTAEGAARSLGISVAQAKQIVQPGITRSKFESQFCNLRSGSTLALDESQTRDLLRREISDFNTGGRLDGRTHFR